MIRSLLNRLFKLEKMKPPDPSKLPAIFVQSHHLDGGTTVSRLKLFEPFQTTYYPPGELPPVIEEKRWTP